MPIHAPETRPRRVALYARVGAADDRDAVLQLDELRTAARQRGWQVVGELTDISIRGGSGKDRRPELHRLMQLVQRGMVDVVAVWRLSDFVRSSRHLTAALQELRDHGVDFYAAQDAIDTTCSDALLARGPDAGLERALVGSEPGDCRKGARAWPRAVRDLARARTLQTRAADRAPQPTERSAELSEADRLRAMSRFLSMRFRDGSLVLPGVAFGPIVRAANPEELARETINAIIEATLEQDPS